MLQNRIATLKSISIAQVIDIHIFTKVKSVTSTKIVNFSENKFFLEIFCINFLDCED